MKGRHTTLRNYRIYDMQIVFFCYRLGVVSLPIHLYIQNSALSLRSKPSHAQIPPTNSSVY